MKHFPSFALLAVTALALQGCASAPSPTQSALVRASQGANCQRLAQPGDQKIQIYCSSGTDRDFVLPLAKALPAGQMQTATASEKAGDTSCRRVAPTQGGAIRRYCGTTAEWDQFDTRAVAAGVTCRLTRGSVGHPADEVCLSSARWESLDRGGPRRTVASGAPGSNWPVDPAINSSVNNQAYATSYGYFPQGTAIGATAGAPPPR